MLMGSYCALEFDGLYVIGSKSHVPDGIISMFQETDRQVITKAPEEQDEEPEITYVYTALRETILARLDILGITSDRAESAFENWRRAEIETYTEYGEGFEETLEAIKSLSSRNGKNAFPLSYKINLRSAITISVTRSKGICLSEMMDGYFSKPLTNV